MKDNKKKEIRNTIRNKLQSFIIDDMFSSYDTNLTCEEVGEEYINAMTELVNRLIDTQSLYPNYINRK